MHKKASDLAIVIGMGSGKRKGQDPEHDYDDEVGSELENAVRGIFEAARKDDFETAAALLCDVIDMKLGMGHDDEDDSDDEAS